MINGLFRRSWIVLPGLALALATPSRAQSSVTLAPSTLAFGNQIQETTSAPKTAALKNIMAIPLLDTTLAISRRFLRGQPIFAADRGHIHHRLLARGFTTRRIAWLLYATAGLLAGLSLLMSNAHYGGGVVVAFCAIFWFAVRYLGYEEFDMARRMVFGGFLRRMLNANLSVTQFEEAVRAARTLDECWKALQD